MGAEVGSAGEQGKAGEQGACQAVPCGAAKRTGDGEAHRGVMRELRGGQEAVQRAGQLDLRGARGVKAHTRT
jgi:hypothetical protein